MDITERDPAQNDLLQGRMCDRCTTRSLNSDVGPLFELVEFVRIRICSGYGARRFADGDVHEIDLCQDCVFEMLSPHARKVASEDDQPRVVTPLMPESGTMFHPDFRSGEQIR